MVPYFAFVHWECFALKRGLLICGACTPAASQIAFIQRRTKTSPIHLLHIYHISDHTHAPLCNAENTSSTYIMAKRLHGSHILPFIIIYLKMCKDYMR